MVRNPLRTRKKIEPPEVAASGGSLCLLTLTASVKPLANIMANYIRYDRHKDFGENFQCRHLLSVARLEKGSTGILSKFSTKINTIASGTGAGLTPLLFFFLPPMSKNVDFCRFSYIDVT